MTRVDLYVLGAPDTRAAWPAGEVRHLPSQPAACRAQLAAHVSGSPAEHILVWDPRLGWPDRARIDALTRSAFDVHHAGLCLGMGGQPAAMDYVHPVWMLNRDPSPEIDATSWRLSLRASLFRTAVFQKMGPLETGFSTLAGAALEYGHRCVTRGVLMRHTPDIVGTVREPAEPLPLEDQFRFLFCRFGRKWAAWALTRAIVTRAAPTGALLRAWKNAVALPRAAEPAPFAGRRHGAPRPECAGSRVSVLVPTIDRYPYLRTLLRQLETQTVPPAEVIVVDQTPPDRRDQSIAREFHSLPLTYLVLDHAGQCRSRNHGLRHATGSHLLFLDDDDEIPQRLIEGHLETMAASEADVSAGVADEVGAGPLPVEFTYVRVSDVCPTNNTLMRTEALARSGLFDLAYDRGQRADGDLGMRLYLSGASMVLDPGNSVLHHHAPRGGLRTHGARTSTYARSRARITRRHLPTVSDYYLAMRYFSRAQLREMEWVSLFATTSVRGSALRRMAKAAVALLLMPDTLLRMAARRRAASEMLRNFPQIPAWPGLAKDV